VLGDAAAHSASVVQPVAVLDAPLLDERVECEPEPPVSVDDCSCVDDSCPFEELDPLAGPEALVAPSSAASWAPDDASRRGAVASWLVAPWPLDDCIIAWPSRLASGAPQSPTQASSWILSSPITLAQDATATSARATVASAAFGRQVPRRKTLRIRSL
jgi:hypothetical protein